MQNNITGKVIIITGASTDLGEVTNRNNVLAQESLESGSYAIAVMINNAGVRPLSLVEKPQKEEWGQMDEFHLKGVLYSVAAALPHMQSRKSGQCSLMSLQRPVIA